MPESGSCGFYFGKHKYYFCFVWSMLNWNWWTTEVRPRTENFSLNTAAYLQIGASIWGTFDSKLKCEL